MLCSVCFESGPKKTAECVSSVVEYFEHNDHHRLNVFAARGMCRSTLVGVDEQEIVSDQDKLVSSQMLFGPVNEELNVLVDSVGSASSTLIMSSKLAEELGSAIRRRPDHVELAFSNAVLGQRIQSRRNVPNTKLPQLLKVSPSCGSINVELFESPSAAYLDKIIR